VILACRNASAADCDELRALLLECDKLGESAERTLEQSLMELTIGIDLHRVIARMSGNPILADMLNGLLDRCQIYIWMDMSLQDSWSEAREDHHTLVNAICARDADLAHAVALQHVRGARTSVVRVIKARETLRSISKPKGLGSLREDLPVTSARILHGKRTGRTGQGFWAGRASAITSTFRQAR
jgi:DNA-binding FadR family transcriptional regulator